ncbi:MAG: T9SS type A sorting domain-containing protein, partial [Candidatus Kapaibacterium sp.]
IIRTDAEMSFINHDTKLYDYEQVYSIEAIGSSHYILARGNNEPDKQYILKTNKEMSKLDTIKVLDNKYYYETYTSNNKLYIKDSTQRIYYFDEQSNELEQVIALNDTVKFKMNVKIFDDEIYSSYKGALLKSIKVAELSETTGASIEEIPSFYIHKAYPNPVKNNFRVRLDYDLTLNRNEINLKYFDITGAEVTKIIDFNIIKYDTFSLELESDISNLNSGIYFIRLNFGNKTETVPFVKE